VSIATTLPAPQLGSQQTEIAKVCAHIHNKPIGAPTQDAAAMLQHSVEHLQVSSMYGNRL
jgi:hypothetical protein